MPQKLYKILLILGIVAILVAMPAFWFTYAAPKDLEVDFLDVGQGDAILIKTPMGQNILIDGGPDNTVIEHLSKNLPWWDRKIDLIILSHPHDDHITSLIDVIKRYRVARILYTGVVHTTPNYLTWLELVRDRNIPLVIIDRPQTIKLGEQCELKILHPEKSVLGQRVNNLNSSSIVVKLIYQEMKFLFTGDIEIEIEQELVDNNINLSAQVLKAGHHGSDTSSSQRFLEAVKPETVVIQAGRDNDFGHPSRRVIKRLERIGAEILRTDLDKTVMLVSDGKSIQTK